MVFVEASSVRVLGVGALRTGGSVFTSLVLVGRGGARC